MSSFLQIIDANKQFTVLSNVNIKQSAIGIVSEHDYGQCSFHRNLQNNHCIFKKVCSKYKTISPDHSTTSHLIRADPSDDNSPILDATLLTCCRGGGTKCEKSYHAGCYFNLINNLSTKFKVPPKHILHVEEYADEKGMLQEKENVLLPYCKQQCFVSLKKEMDKAEADAKKPESTSWNDNEVEHLSSYYILIDWMTSGSNYGNYSKAKDTHGRTKAGSKLDVAVEIQQHIFDKNGEFVLLNFVT